MKKTLLALTVAGVMLVAGCASAALTYTWDYVGGGDANLSTWDVTVGAGWLVQMYTLPTTDPSAVMFDLAGTPTVGGSPGISVLTFGATGTFVSFTTGGPGPNPAAIEGANVYSVLFNAATLGGGVGDATHAVILDAATTFMPNDGTKSYQVGLPAGQWVPLVPEPGSIALFGLGLITLVVAHRRRRAR